MNSLYFDHCATTQISPDVAAAMVHYFAGGYGNPASLHAIGRDERGVLEEAREEIGRILGADVTSLRGDRVVFTSGGTDANNLAVLGTAARWQAGQMGPAGQIVISAIEHPSVVGPAEFLARQGWQVERLPVSREGIVRVDELSKSIGPETRLVSVMLVNNETGVVQPVRAIADICRERSVPLHVDAVQGVGKIAVSFRELGADLMSVAAHKFHGPPGIGALLVRAGVDILPILHGGHQQAGVRPGTEPVALAVGMAAALREWEESASERFRALAELRDSFEARLVAGWPGLVVNGAAAERAPHVSNVAFPGLDRQGLFLALDAAEIACSTGSACASGSSEPSPVLRAMGLAEEVVGSSLRFSFGAPNTAAEVADGVQRILAAAKNLQGLATKRKRPAEARERGAKPV